MRDLRLVWAATLGVALLMPAPGRASGDTDRSNAPTGVPSSLIEPFQALRLQFASRPEYSGSWTGSAEREAVTKALEQKKTEEFLVLSEGWLASCPVDARIQLARAAALAATGDLAGAARHRMMFYGLLSSILSSGDGKSRETAYGVISVDEEYTVVSFLGASLERQTLEDHYDVLQLTRDGKPLTLYFDAAIPLRATSAFLRGEKKP